MADASIPFTNVGSGYTIVTQGTPSSSAPTSGDRDPSQTELRKFLKGEPSALGTVQIMIGVMMVLFGIVMTVYPQTIGVYSGAVYWASLFHIIAGCLAVSASRKLTCSLVKGAMVMNIFSAIAAGISIILLALDLAIGPLPGGCYYDYYSHKYKCQDSSISVSRTKGITGVLLVFSLLQFIISLVVSAFTCKAICTSEPTDIVNVVPNPDGSVPVVNTFPAHHAQPGVSTPNAVAMSAPPLASAPPVESPPAYTEKSQPGY